MTTRLLAALALPLSLALGPGAAAARAGQAPGGAPSPPAGEALRDDAFTAPRAAWFRDAKYGMFIHWGLYAVPAGEYQGKRAPGTGEWIMETAKIPVPEYEKFAAQFNPVKFNAQEWVDVARQAGMRYLVITAKHHDGFSLFDTKVNDYNVVKATPFRRDPIRELAAACRAEGIRFGLYYSILDWHHPDANAANLAKYEPQMREQLRELVTRYDPDLLWFDGDWVPWWTEEKGRELERFLRGLKPTLLINNRIGKRKRTDGDYDTPEQEIPRTAPGGRLWETCMTLNDTWGYRKDDHNWKSPEDVLKRLADIAGKGGNFLLNVGPTAEGEIPEESVRILRKVGSWLAENGEAIYGTTGTPLPTPPWGRVARKGNTLYLIVFDWPQDLGALRLGLLSRPAGRAFIPKTDSQVVVKRLPDDQGLDIYPTPKPAEDLASIILLEFQGDLVSVPAKE